MSTTETQREMVEQEEPERDFTRHDMDLPDAEPARDDEPSDEVAKQEEGLFDADEYEGEGLRLPAFDGRRPNRIAVGFSGTVELDRGCPDDVALLRRLRLGQEVELRVSGIVASRPHTIKQDPETGDIVDVISAAKVKVHSITVEGE